MSITNQTPPPQLNWNHLVREKTKTLPEGVITEYALENGNEASTSIAQMNGTHPGRGWVRNAGVDLWYVMLRGEAEVTFEGVPLKKIKALEWLFLPKGVWYRVSFRNALLEMPSIPAWTPEQAEQKS